MPTVEERITAALDGLAEPAHAHEGVAETVMAKRRHLRTRRRSVAALAAVALVAGAVTVFFAIDEDATTNVMTRPAAPSTSLPDEQLRLVIDVVGQGFAGQGVALTAGQPWVGRGLPDTSQQELVRIDPASGSVDASARIGHPVYPMTEDAETVAIWAAGGGDGGEPVAKLSKVDGTTGALLGQLTLEAAAIGLEVGFSSLWVLGQHAVLEINPETVTVLARHALDIGTDDFLAGIAVGHGSLWITQPRSGTLTRMAPGGNVLDEVHVEGAGAVTVTDEAVWVTSFPERRLISLNRVDLSVEAELDLPGAPSALASSGDDVWVGGDGFVMLVDAATGQVRASADVPGYYATSIAVGPDDIWVKALNETHLLRVRVVEGDA